MNPISGVLHFNLPHACIVAGHIRVGHRKVCVTEGCGRLVECGKSSRQHLIHPSSFTGFFSFPFSSSSPEVRTTQTVQEQIIFYRRQRTTLSYHIISRTGCIELTPVAGVARTFKCNECKRNPGSHINHISPRVGPQTGAPRRRAPLLLPSKAPPPTKQRW